MKGFWLNIALVVSFLSSVGAVSAADRLLVSSGGVNIGTLSFTESRRMQIQVGYSLNVDAMEPILSQYSRLTVPLPQVLRWWYSNEGRVISPGVVTVDRFMQANAGFGYRVHKSANFQSRDSSFESYSPGSPETGIYRTILEVLNERDVFVFSQGNLEIYDPVVFATPLTLTPFLQENNLYLNIRGEEMIKRWYTLLCWNRESRELETGFMVCDGSATTLVLTGRYVSDRGLKSYQLTVGVTPVLSFDRILEEEPEREQQTHSTPVRSRERTSVFSSVKSSQLSLPDSAYSTSSGLTSFPTNAGFSTGGSNWAKGSHRVLDELVRHTINKSLIDRVSGSIQGGMPMF